MTTELAKAYDPKTIEKDIYERWIAAGAFHADPAAGGPKYAIVIPPPNVTAALHLGHALNNTLQDILIRMRRMQGYNTLWMPGTDHAGIATQTVVEKRILAEEGKRRTDFERADFVARIQTWKDDYEARILNQLKTMGCSCDWDRTRFTMDEMCAKAVRATFFKLFSDGLIYRGKRLVNWDPATQTVLADDEVEHEEINGHFYYLKYPLTEAVVVSNEGDSAVCGMGVSPMRPEGVSPSESLFIRQGSYLPHWTKPGAKYAVSFRLADSLPQETLAAWRLEREEIELRAQQQGRALTTSEQKELDRLYSTRVETFLDAGQGECLLRDARIAKLVQDALLHFDNERYELIAWAIMPNHVHVVVKPLPGNELPAILHSWKSFTAKECNKVLNRQGSLWQEESYDHLIRDEEDFNHQIAYILGNPEKAGLIDWPWVGLKDQGQDAPGTHGRDAHATNGAAITYITVATTRPETMLGDTAVAMNPRDPRAKFLVGKMVRLPIVGRLIPIIADEHVVLPDPDSDDPKARVSTGFLKVTPAHDPDDYAIGQRHNLPVINVMAPDASISDKHGWSDWEQVKNTDVEQFIGLDRFEARKAIINWMREEELLEKIIDYTHQVGHSYRSHVPIEPYLSDQWYVAVKKPIPGCELAMTHSKLTDDQVEKRDGAVYFKGTDVPVDSLAGLALMPLLDGRLNFTPARYANNYRSWLENLRDWPISRQLWWGHQIPVWHVSLRYQGLYEPGIGYRDGWTPEACYKDFEQAFQRFATAAGITGEYHLVPDPRMPGNLVFICSKTKHSDSCLQHLKEMFENWNPAKLISSGQISLSFNYGEDSKAFVLVNKIISIEQDTDVLDTWFSSALWPFSTLGWPDQTDALKTWFPGDVLCTAREIITLWVSRMVMMGQYCAGDIPFHDVFIHAMIQDGEGRKMSKSLGNGIDPLDIIDSHGSDAMRFTLASMTTQTQDVRMPVEKLKLPDGRELNSSPKFDLGRNFANKLWNASRFAMMNLAGMPAWHEIQSHANLADTWILSSLQQTIRSATAAIDAYRFNELADTLYHFMWDDFCDWYLEIAKSRINAGQAAPKAIVAHVLDNILRLLHPIMPFITEAIWRQLNEIAPVRGPSSQVAETLLIKAAWPMANGAEISASAQADFEVLRELIRAIRNVRTQHNVAPSKRIPVVIEAQGAAGRLVADNLDLMKSQAGLSELTIVAQDGAAQAGDNAASIAAGGYKVYVMDIIDKTAELARLTKQAEVLRKGIAGIEGKLGNPGFLAKAPADLVAKETARLASLRADLAAIEASLAGLK